jgi:hypothetical protein
VVISDWQKAGICDQAAEDCLDAKTFQAEVWAQLKTSLNSHGEEILKDNDLYTCFMADEVIVRRPNDAGQEKLVTQEPLLINQRNTWHLRPEAFTRIDNLFLASDYVRTNTDLATMEAANEAARRAVNCIIDRVNHQRLFFKRLSYCKIWTLHEPYCLWYWRRRDYRRNQRGLPWDGKIGILSKMTLFLLKILLLIVMKIVVKPYSESDSHETTQRV